MQLRRTFLEEDTQPDDTDSILSFKISFQTVPQLAQPEWTKTEAYESPGPGSLDLTRIETANRILDPPREKVAPKPDLEVPRGTKRKNSEGSSSLLESFQIEFTEILVGEQIGSGSYGVVKRATWQTKDIAIKILHESGKEELFFKEAELLCKLRHPNIVHCYGVCAHPNQCIVMEFLPNNLYAEIQKGPITNWKKFLTIATGIALGLGFLHESDPQILHRDLKPGNILLEHNFMPRIADFGISREKPMCQGTMSMTRIGTPVYTAPEIHNSRRYNHKVDIYSLGMVMYAMTVGSSPWKNLKLSNFQICVRLAIKNERPEFLPTTSTKLIRIIGLCWHQNPTQRPSAAQVVQMLQTSQSTAPQVLDIASNEIKSTNTAVRTGVTISLSEDTTDESDSDEAYRLPNEKKRKENVKLKNPKRRRLRKQSSTDGDLRSPPLLDITRSSPKKSSVITLVTQFIDITKPNDMETEDF